MMKSILVKGMAVVALGLMVVSCAEEDSYSDADSLKRAENVLGFKIAPGQDWKTTATATARVSVNLNYDETYTVKVYANNPLVDDVAYVLAQGTVVSGETFVKEFDYAAASQSLFVAVTDSKGFTSYKLTPIENGVLTATFGTAPTPAAARGMRRSQTAPVCPDLTVDYDAAWLANYLTTAKEPDNVNINDNYDNKTWVEGKASEKVYTPATIVTEPVDPNFGWADDPVGMIMYNWGSPSAEDVAFYNTVLKAYIDAYNKAPISWTQQNDPKAYVESKNKKIDAYYAIKKVLANNNRSHWMNVYQEPVYGVISGGEEYWTEATEGHWQADETYVVNFKIIGTWNGSIPVVATEGYSTITWNDTKKINELSNPNGNARTVVVTGTWNISNEQRVGGGAKIIVADGGKINISSGGQLNFVNQAQLVVLRGGEISGEGTVQVTNGNEDGSGSYNAGTINVHKFNNNFGKFFNYGTFKAEVYAAGAAESNFYNHGLVVIDGTKETGNDGAYYVSSNARVFNNCQFYVKQDARLRNYEGVGGSALIVGGELMLSSSADGTSDPTYVGLASGALVKCGTLYNNGTSWTGPERGYAALEITDKITYLNWEQDAPENGGYFENNIYVAAGTWNSVPLGNGYQQTDPSDEANYKVSVADYKFFAIIANCRGNNGVTKVQASASGEEIIPASDDFELGVKGCTPGFKGVPPTEIVEEAQIFSYAFEDSYHADYDMNDVVVKVSEVLGTDSVELTLCCTGASYNLYLFLREDGVDKKLFNGMEVHRILGGTAGKFINTGNAQLRADNPGKFEIRPTQSYRIKRPSGTLGQLDIWLKSPEGEIHVAKAGQDPHGVVIPFDWQWPKEFKSVKLAYSGFSDFAQSVDPASTWYNTAVSGEVITAADLTE
jgi:hypothetical protein